MSECPYCCQSIRSQGFGADENAQIFTASQTSSRGLLPDDMPGAAIQVVSDSSSVQKHGEVNRSWLNERSSQKRGRPLRLCKRGRLSILRATRTGTGTWNYNSELQLESALSHMSHLQ
jgi:hypothetical protein